MLFQDHQTAKRLMEARSQDPLRRMDSYLLLPQVKPRKVGRLVLLWGRILCSLGRRLITRGEQLQARRFSQPLLPREGYCRRSQ
jgi:hypothetical protein